MTDHRYELLDRVEVLFQPWNLTEPKWCPGRIVVISVRGPYEVQLDDRTLVRCDGWQDIRPASVQA